MNQEARSRKIRIKKGDKVKVVTGKDVGREGEVEKVIRGRASVVVAGVNLVKKHLKQQSEKEKGGIVDIAAPIDISNVMLICPKCSKPTRVSYEVTDGGRKIRMCKRCGKEID